MSTRRARHPVARAWSAVLLLGLATAAPAQQAAIARPATPVGLGGPLLEFRSIDGSGNNLAHPDWGAAHTTLQRLTPADYADGAHSPSGAQRPGAREVSNAVVAQDGPLPNAADVTDFVWQWGQFLDHDLDLTELADPPEPFDIEVPLGDPHFDPMHTGTVVIPLERSQYETKEGVRQQVNAITSWIDASNVYGSDEVRAAALRTINGRLRMSPGKLLPFNVVGLPNAPSADDPSMFLAGDVRANEQVGLTALHTLFVREHNRIVRRLRVLGVAPDLRYDVARALVGAEMQRITYEEFLPVLLGPDALPPYTGYDPHVDASISNLFSTVAYRFGHSMLSPVLLRLDAQGQPLGAGHLPLAQAFFAPQEVLDHGIEPVLRGLAAQRPQEIDTHLVDDVRNMLFGPPGSGGFDLASLNIQRGRDHGICSYNQARVARGLVPAATWADISSDPAVQADLAAVYESVDDVDAWVGALAEDHVPGALVGELVHVVLVTEFTRLRDGDRLWYQRALPPFLQGWVATRSLSRIIRDNTSIGPGQIQANVFVGPTHGPE